MAINSQHVRVSLAAMHCYLPYLLSEPASTIASRLLTRHYPDGEPQMTANHKLQSHHDDGNKTTTRVKPALRPLSDGILRASARTAEAVASTLPKDRNCTRRDSAAARVAGCAAARTGFFPLPGQANSPGRLYILRNKQ